MIFDIIIQNNATKQTEVIKADGVMSELYITFDNIEIDAPDGEYSYAVICNGRDDVRYNFKNVLLDTEVHTDEGDCLLSDLRPIVGLMRIGAVGMANQYKNNTTNNYYYYEG